MVLVYDGAEQFNDHDMGKSMEYWQYWCRLSVVSGEILEHCSDTVSPAGEIETISLHVLRKDRLGKGESPKKSIPLGWGKEGTADL